MPAVTKSRKKPIAKSPLMYGVEDVMLMLDCSRSYAYNIIKTLRKELEDKGYMPGPAGKVRKSYFDERFYMPGEVRLCSK